GEIVWAGPVGEHAGAEAAGAPDRGVQPCADGAVTLPPIPPGHRRPIGERRGAFTLARYDRLSVLTGELKRMTATGAPVALRLAGSAPLTGPRLASALSWV